MLPGIETLYDSFRQVTTRQPAVVPSHHEGYTILGLYASASVLHAADHPPTGRQQPPLTSVCVPRLSPVCLRLCVIG